MASENPPELPGKKGKPPQLLMSRFKQAEFARNIWRIVPEHGTSTDDIIAPLYWSHVAAHLKPFDKIEVLAEDGSFYAELLVITVGHGAVRVAPLFLRVLDGTFDEQVSDFGEYEVRYKGPHWKWCVIRKADSQAVMKEIPTRDAAQRAAIEFRARAA